MDPKYLQLNRARSAFFRGHAKHGPTSAIYSIAGGESAGKKTLAAQMLTDYLNRPEVRAVWDHPDLVKPQQQVLFLAPNPSIGDWARDTSLEVVKTLQADGRRLALDVLPANSDGDVEQAALGRTVLAVVVLGRVPTDESWAPYLNRALSRQQPFSAFCVCPTVPSSTLALDVSVQEISGAVIGKETQPLQEFLDAEET